MNILAEKYTRILIAEVAEKSAEEFLSILSCFAKLFEENKKLTIILNSPIVEKSDKIQVLEKIIKETKIKVPTILRNLLILLARSNNLKLLGLITKLFHNQMLKKQGITEAKVIFAAKPSDKKIEKVSEILKKKYKINPIISVKIDESILAGFIATFDGKRLDSSLNSSFNNMTNKLHTSINLY